MPRQRDTPTSVAFTGTRGVAEVGIGDAQCTRAQLIRSIYVFDCAHRNR